MPVDRFLARARRVRWMLAAVAASLVVLAALSCSGGPDRRAEPTTTRNASPTTSGASTSSASVPVGTAEPSSTATAPPSTRPLVTAPPSPLLDEVLAAYDAAYADLLAAEAVMDENFPALDDHIADGELDQWREVIRGARADGVTARKVPGVTAWRRVEGVSQPSPDRVVLEVCREDDQERVLADGTGTGADGRPFRYLETMDRIDGRWMWTGREWIDSSGEVSDCALP